MKSIFLLAFDLVFKAPLIKGPSRHLKNGCICPKYMRSLNTNMLYLLKEFLYVFHVAGRNVLHQSTNFHVALNPSTSASIHRVSFLPNHCPLGALGMIKQKRGSEKGFYGILQHLVCSQTHIHRIQRGKNSNTL